MWGNRLGWTISAGIVISTTTILWLIANSSARTPPTDFSADERNFAQLNAPQPPEIPAATQSSSSPSGGGSYRAAIATYLADRSAYENLAALAPRPSAELPPLPAIDKIVAAAGSSQPQEIFASHPREVIGYESSKPAIEALDVLDKVMLSRLAMRAKSNNRPEEALKYARAAAAFGNALCRERLCWDEFSLGQRMLSEAAFFLGSNPPADDGDAAKWRAYEDQRAKFFSEFLEPRIRFIRSIDPNIVGTRTGDVFQLAKRSQERMFRVEAILALGRVRYFTGTSRSAADQRAALAVLKRIAADDPDPIIRAAAEAARDLTAEQYRMQ